MGAEILRDEGLQIADGPLGALQAGALRQGQLQRQLALVRARHELATQRRQQGSGTRYQRRGGQQHDDAAPEQRPQQSGVAREVDRADRQGPAAAAQQPRAQHGDDDEGDEERRQQREGDGPRLLAEELAGGPVEVDDGQEDDDGGQRGAGDRTPDLARSQYRRLRQRLSLLEVAEDVLHHHNSVVDEHTGAQRQPAQSHEVERQITEIHEVEGGDYGDRDSDADDRGDADATQKDVEHEHRQKDADEAGLLNLRDGRLDEARLVLDHLDLISW